MNDLRFARGSWLLLALMFGCSESIEVGSGGGSGSTTDTSSTGDVTGTGGASGTTTTTGSTTTSSTTSGMGGASGDACAQACDFVATCGVPGNQCLMYLDCTNPQGECAANCVNQPGVTCQAIFSALQGQPGPLTDCITACQGTGVGGGGMGGFGAGGGGVGGAGSGNQQQCQQCAQNQCSAELQQCFQAGGCQSWVQCAQACQDQACLSDCSAMYPSGAPVQTCICTDCVNAGCGYTCD